MKSKLSWRQAVETTEDARGNQISAALAWAYKHDDWLDSLEAHMVLLTPGGAPVDETERNRVVLGWVSRAARERGYDDLADLLTSTSDVFGVLLVLGEGDEPSWDEEDGQLQALSATLRGMSCWTDEIMRDLASDASMVWGVGDTEALEFLPKEWPEFIASLRVARETAGS